MMFAPAPEEQQPESFVFSKENLKKAQAYIARYPEGRQQSAVMPLLDLAQRQSGGWLPRAAIEAVANMLSMPFMRAYEVATFYTMYNLRPVGKHFIQVCRTSPCWLRGSDDLVSACKRKLGTGLGETTEDGEFTVVEVECLGACANAPMVQINDHYYEDLTAESMEQLIDDLKAGNEVAVGSQAGRTSSEPLGELTSLTNSNTKKKSATKATAKKTETNKAPAKKAPAKKATAKKPAAKKTTKKKES